MRSTGLQLFQSVAEGNPIFEPWTNLSNVLTDTGSVADCRLRDLAGATSRPILATNRAGAGDVPSTATVKGVTVEVERRATNGSGTARDLGVYLIIPPATASTAKMNGVVWPGTLTPISYGSPVDLWDEALTPAIVNDPLFGVGVQCEEIGGVNAITAEVQRIRVNVHYSGGGSRSGRGRRLRARPILQNLTGREP